MEKIKLFWDKVNEWHTSGLYKDLRKGQLYFNVLYDIDKVLANKIFLLDIPDPFYVDARIPEFFTIVHKEWGIS